MEEGIEGSLEELEPTTVEEVETDLGDGATS
jgi:hypothetical protein